jgi:hypothetical protein
MKKEKPPLEKFIRFITLYSAYKALRNHYKRIKLILLTYGSLGIFVSYLWQSQKNKSIEKKYKKNQRQFLLSAQSLNLSNDWFSGNIPYWLSIFDEYNLQDKELNVLEIGSWEGLSSYFILSTLPKSQLTCVDTWQGADEHKDGAAATSDVLNQIENKFDENLKPFKDRFIKHKCSSFHFFGKKIFDKNKDFLVVTK